MFCDLESRNYLRPFSWKWPNFESTTEYWINIYVYVFSVVKCRDPGEKENAYKETTLDSDPYNCGTQLTFHCRHGYQMYGNSTMICGEDGYFKIPIFYCAKIGKLYINFSSLNDSFCIMTSYLLLDSNVRRKRCAFYCMMYWHTNHYILRH